MDILSRLQVYLKENPVGSNEGENPPVGIVFSTSGEYITVRLAYNDSNLVHKTMDSALAYINIYLTSRKY